MFGQYSQERSEEDEETDSINTKSVSKKRNHQEAKTRRS
jgi:hypothetical protein